jgi:BirA family biotin operon repressor/biotin-[acetyl-CoA-carboxylase] ligase
MERLSMQVIRRKFDAREIGRHLCLFDEVESTNAVAHDLARSGAGSGTVVLAESQRNGRGRLGRPWFSPPGVNLYASVLLREDLRLDEAGPVSFIASLSVCDDLRELKLAPAIKWPNDVLLERRKVAGAMMDWVTRGNAVQYAVLGVGVNLNVDLATLREALGPQAVQATSVAAVLGYPVDRSSFTAAVLTHLEAWWRRYRLDGASPLVAAWQERDILTGRRVELRGPGTSVEGRARGLDAAGHLIVDTAPGERRVVLTEDVRILE